MQIDPDRIDRLATVLIQSVVTGCTAMINRKLLILARSMPEEAFMHDRWIALLTAGLGKAGVVRSPTVLYRQHAENVLGTGQQSSAGEPAAQMRSPVARLMQPRISAGYLTGWKMSQRKAPLC